MFDLIVLLLYFPVSKKLFVYCGKVFQMPKLGKQKYVFNKGIYSFGALKRYFAWNTKVLNSVGAKL